LRVVRRFLLALALLISVAPACVVDDEIPEGLRELRPEIGSARLVREADGSGRLDFSFRYVMAITDEAGIAEVRWIYSLVDRQQSVLGQVEQRMREPQPEKTQILVQGERSRTLPIDAGKLRPGGRYVVWITVTYPGEDGRQAIVGELLHPVDAE
jgi:hypothetical protein